MSAHPSPSQQDDPGMMKFLGWANKLSEADKEELVSEMEIAQDVDSDMEKEELEREKRYESRHGGRIASTNSGAHSSRKPG